MHPSTTKEGHVAILRRWLACSGTSRMQPMQLKQPHARLQRRRRGSSSAWLQLRRRLRPQTRARAPATPSLRLHAAAGRWASHVLHQISTDLVPAVPEPAQGVPD